MEMAPVSRRTPLFDKIGKMFTDRSYEAMRLMVAHSRPERIDHALRDVFREAQGRRPARLAVRAVGTALAAIAHRVVGARAVAAVAGE